MARRKEKKEPESEPLRDNVPVTVTFTGKKDDVESGLAGLVADEIVRRTGVPMEGIGFSEEELYKVTLQAKRGKGTLVGESTVGLDHAIEQAAAGAPYNTKHIEVEATRTAHVPYFQIPVTVRSLNPEQLGVHHEADVDQLANTYGARLVREPDGLEFRVVHSRKNYKGDGQLPKGKFKGRDVISEARADTLAFAIRDARPDDTRRVRSTIHEQTALLMVYGTVEQTVTARVTEPRSGRKDDKRRRAPRGAAPAGREPVYLTSSASLL